VTIFKISSINLKLTKFKHYYLEGGKKEMSVQEKLHGTLRKDL